eukprot:TRINITY_DN48290_c0_g1_i1.p1 TRINITY_DN48290_c0_g1~~TRINITY_DN48290_c0_g1_i1.p1  ORF type:complete len:1192 (+),score=121.47 TRINITY_DN48290_c0_g1_i1:108-3578(+)
MVIAARACCSENWDQIFESKEICATGSAWWRCWQLVALFVVEWFVILPHAEGVELYFLWLSALFSTLATWFLLRRNQDRRSIIPASLLALTQVGPPIELMVGLSLQFCPEKETRQGTTPQTGDGLRGRLESLHNVARLLVDESFTSSSVHLTQISPGLRTREKVRGDTWKDARNLIWVRILSVVVGSLVLHRKVPATFDELQWNVPFRMCGGEMCGSVNEDMFDAFFQQSRSKIVKRVCPLCHTSFQVLVYTRLTPLANHRISAIMTRNWTGLDNRLNTDYTLLGMPYDHFSSVSFTNDFQEGSSDSGCRHKGMPGDIYTTSSPRFQWTSSDVSLWCRGMSKDAEFRVKRDFLAWDTILTKQFMGIVIQLLAAVSVISVMATAITDLIVWILIQTTFVKQHRGFIWVFHFVEYASNMVFYSLVTQCYANSAFIVVWCGSIFVSFPLLFAGFNARRLGPSLSQMTARLISVFSLSCFVAFFIALFGVNFVFFDRSLSFRPMKHFYHFVFTYGRFVWFFWNHAIVVGRYQYIGFVFPIAHLLMAYGLVPLVRRRRLQRCGGTNFQTGEETDEEDAMHAIRAMKSAALPQEAQAMLPVIGDTFEALLLASRAHSPRVRQGILAVAVEPWSFTNAAVLRQMLPLILPQILLALRWTSDAGERKGQCPLTRFIIERVVDVQDLKLVGLVYWQLFALATDTGGCADCIYRAVRKQFLIALENNSWQDTTFDATFCKSALSMLADQCRIYSQMRSIARYASMYKGSTRGKTALLRESLSNDDIFARWHGTTCIAPKPERRISIHPRTSLHPLRGNRFERNLSRTRRCLRAMCCLGRQKAKAIDRIKEELEAETVLHKHENYFLDLREIEGWCVPVELCHNVIGVDPSRCFVANSAVAPVVFSCETDEEDPVDRRLYALKAGDDLRQDALILQMFRLMETVWIENGLPEMRLRPYTVLPISTDEGMMAFVPDAVNISRILFEFEGNVRAFIVQNCQNAEQAFRNLCGSAAGHCVATYILGIGDRHLDNLMITKNGHFFHIDFGFVLGEDPKPAPLALRIPREVVDAIREVNLYDVFENMVGEGFSLLRRSSHLWTSLLELAREAGGNGVGALQRGGLESIRERLAMHLDEATARSEIVGEVYTSIHSPLPVIMDKLHQAGIAFH